MPLDAAELTAIEALLAATAEPAHAVADLRRCFPGLTVTQCDRSDVDLETPFRTIARVSIYLVDGTDHCWRLTTDTARATGLVLVAT
jgi:hypothetical protein